MAATPVFNEITFQKAPDRTAVKTDEVQKLADQLKRPCAIQDAVAWSSANPANDLKTFPASVMRNLRNFTDLSERLDWPGRRPDASRRLYLGMYEPRDDAFTFLWIAGKSDVSLHICGNQPKQLKKHPEFNNCAEGVGGLKGVLGKKECKLENADM